MMRVQCFVIVLNFFIFLFGATNAERPVSYPIQWETVPSTPPDARNLESPYLGECRCDVTWGLCDPNCCCDRDCTTAEKNMFPFCLQETFGSFPLEYCHVQNESKIKYRTVRQYVDKKNKGQGATCIFRSNNLKEMISYFVVPKNVSNPPAKKFDQGPEAVKSEGYVVNGDLLLMKRIEVDGFKFELRSVGLFRIPSARRDGYCTLQGRRVRFMNPLDTTSCVLRGESICALFPTFSYSNLFLTNPSKNNSQKFTPINLQIFDDISGKLLVVVDSNSSIPVEYQSLLSSAVCKNGVVRVRSSLIYSSDELGFTLKNATMNLYIRDIKSHDVVSLLFQTEFFHVGIVPPLNVFPATPGYLDGSRVRAGTLLEKDGKKAIAERVAGFSVPSGGRSCDQNNYRKVSFLHDVRSSGCTVRLSEKKLREVCSGTGTGAMLRSILSINAKHSFHFDDETKPIDYVARTNDAHTNDTTSWIKIEGLDFVDIAPKPYDFVKRECRNIYVGVHYKFLLSRVGAVNNPQDVIVAVFADPIIGKWRVRNTSDFTINALTTQRFRFLVSFGWVDPNSQPAISVGVAAPNVLPRVDDTILYPFETS